jgi:hypothetical protein
MDWLYFLIGAVLVVWLLGLLLKIGGKLIHILILVAVAFFVLRLLGVL